MQNNQDTDSITHHFITDTVTVERLALFLYLNQFIGFTTNFSRTGLPNNVTSLRIVAW